MTSTAFRAHLEALCWTQRGFAALLGVAHNTVHRWALGQARIPEDVARWLERASLWLTEHPPPGYHPPEWRRTRLQADGTPVRTPNPPEAPDAA